MQDNMMPRSQSTSDDRRHGIHIPRMPRDQYHMWAAPTPRPLWSVGSGGMFQETGRMGYIYTAGYWINMMIGRNKTPLSANRI